MTAAIGIELNNPGHIEIGDPWQGLAPVQKHSRFATFTDPIWGLRAIARTLITYYDNRAARDGSRIDTVQEIIERWAPPEDNNPTDNYARFVASGIPVGVNDKINVYDADTMRALVTGIVRFETGQQPYSRAQIDRALELAGIVAPPPPVTQDIKVVGATATAATATTVAVVAQSSDAMLGALQSLVPLGKEFGIAFAVTTAVVSLVLLRLRLKERKEP